MPYGDAAILKDLIAGVTELELKNSPARFTAGMALDEGFWASLICANLNQIFIKGRREDLFAIREWSFPEEIKRSFRKHAKYRDKKKTGPKGADIAVFKTARISPLAIVELKVQGAPKKKSFADDKIANDLKRARILKKTGLKASIFCMGLHIYTTETEIPKVFEMFYSFRPPRRNLSNYLTAQLIELKKAGFEANTHELGQLTISKHKLKIGILYYIKQI